MVVTDRAGLHDTMTGRRGDDGATPSWPERLRFPVARPTGFSGHDDDPGNDCGGDHRDDRGGGPTDSVGSRDDTTPELDCLRHVLAPALLQAAARRGYDLQIGADRVLIHHGLIDEGSYLRHLSHALSLDIEEFDERRRADCPLSDAQIPAAAAAGITPLRLNGDLVWVLAPQRLTSRGLCLLLARFPETRPRLRLSSAIAQQNFLAKYGASALTETSCAELQRRFPALSAAPPHAPLWRQRLQRGGCVAAVMVLPLCLDPEVTTAFLAIWFIGFAGLRLLASLWPRRAPPISVRRPDADLPVYTVVAALYREADSVGPLVEALEALDYPPEKLDLILVIEPDDLFTRAALARLKPRPHLRVLIAPAVAPKTKPKALNYALAFARGSFIAVFDAEDRPDPGQLRAALAAFDGAGRETACVQASLCIDNLTHSWLSRTFLAEYAGQFDLFLPGLAALGLPLPLGGSSNHFRTDVLRAIGAWDPHNVTEDADLGFRLARLGYRCGTFASTTYEEAPLTFGNWLRQRSRWMKGWIQTWEVHMRHPLRLWRETGIGGVLALNLLLGGNVLSALAYPLLLMIALMSAADWADSSPNWLAADTPTALHWLAISSGVASTIVVGLLGLVRRRQWRHAGVLMLTPLYWLCLSIAAWRALAHYVWCPYRWDKTQHGVASRPHPLAPKASAWRRRWRRSEAATDTASDRPQPPRACA
ncbi:glycosyltransferase [Rhodopseudomonas sp. WA056]|uniref:Glycosyl transferase family 2 n=1 Tax=Rhodopseudomonas palustris (strain DX-1) TaxID=652103 RepID=E6VF01_RHOPX|nr:glycosyltransferase family 2 protein [Rhodopseudomonas sp. WA056]NEW88395.1 glycosyltransferase [Rhodopseudomonas sp. WA056]